MSLEIKEVPHLAGVWVVKEDTEFFCSVFDMRKLNRHWLVQLRNSSGPGLLHIYRNEANSVDEVIKIVTQALKVLINLDEEYTDPVAKYGDYREEYNNE